MDACNFLQRPVGFFNTQAPVMNGRSLPPLKIRQPVAAHAEFLFALTAPLDGRGIAQHHWRNA